MNTTDAFQQLLEQLSNQRLFERSVAEIDVEARISSARSVILRHLMVDGPKTLSALAAFRKVTAPTMSKLVASLVEQGLVLRACSKKDKRSIIFIITRKGRELVDINARIINQRIGSAIEKLSQTEQLKLKDAIDLIKKVTESIIKKDK